MPVRQNDRIGWNEISHAVVALDQLIASLAYGRTISSKGLIEAQGNATTTIAVQHHLIHVLHVLEVVDARGNVERDRFPRHCRLVVDEAGVHAEDHESSRRKLAAGDIIYIGGFAMHDDDADMWRGTGVWSIERGISLP